MEDFVEQEKEIIEIIDWEHSAEARNTKSEIDFLYNWWLEKLNKEDDLDGKQYEEDNQC